ncbi:hypothetical protein NL676_017651 [Syzygium grande]|nr:hypothetical protein NL676_017651 [Syzygium grande]
MGVSTTSSTLIERARFSSEDLIAWKFSQNGEFRTTDAYDLVINNEPDKDCTITKENFACSERPWRQPKNRFRHIDQGENGSAEVRDLREESATLRTKAKNLENEYKTKDKEAKTAEAETEALKKQSEGLLEYDHLLADNQSLRSQLESIDHSSSTSDIKKNT